MKELLFLCHRIPYPPNKGDKIRSWNILRRLAGHFRVHLASFVDDPADHQYEDAVREYCGETRFVPLDRRMAVVRSAAGILVRRPLTLAYYHDAGLGRWVRDVVTRRQLDRAYVFSSPMAQFVMGPWSQGMRRIADLVDVDSEKWRQYATRRSWPAQALFAREGRLLLDFERHVAREFDAVILVSRLESELFSRLAPEAEVRVHTVPNGVDEAYFSPGHRYENPFSPAITPVVFVGAMDYWPNIDASAWFAKEILPRLAAGGAPVTFFIVGANPSPDVVTLGRLPGVVVTGRVPDVRPYLAHAAAVVAPLRIARGIQNKILEAMAMAKVVVTTTAGLEGIDAEPGIHLRVADEPATFATAVQTAIADNENETLGVRARERVVARHVWGESIRQIEAIIDGNARQETLIRPASAATRGRRRTIAACGGQRPW